MKAQLLRSNDIFLNNKEGALAIHESFDDIWPYQHTHDFFEIFLVTRGMVNHQINERSETLGAGSLIFIRPQDEHIYSKYKKLDCRLINLAFTEKLCLDVFAYLGLEARLTQLINMDLPPKILISETKSQIISNRIHQLQAIPMKDSMAFNTELRILVMLLLTDHFRNTSSSNASYSEPEWLHQLCLAMTKS